MPPLKLKIGRSGSGQQSVPSTPQAETAGAAAPSSASRPFKLSLKKSQPPTPANETAPHPLAPASAAGPAAGSSRFSPALAEPLGPPTSTKPLKKTKIRKEGGDGASSHKRAHVGDGFDGATPKRPKLSIPNRKVSLKLGGGASADDGGSSTPTGSARLKLSHSRKASLANAAAAAAESATTPTQTPRFNIVNKKAPPKRPVGVGYDSEASDAELDPLIESQFVLRMQPGEDCDYLREHINNKTMGVSKHQGGADVSFKFLDTNCRRALIVIQGRHYAAVMVDLPCIVESQKSWDKRGWWKVADICQMLLVLGRCESEAEAKTHALPKEVDKDTFAYAHGLTPPMHWVRKRRFRKRASYRAVEHVDDEVDRLIKADEAAHASNFEIVDTTASAQAQQEEEYYDDDYDEGAPDGGYRTSTEDHLGQSTAPAAAAAAAAADEEDQDPDFEDALAAAMAEDDDDDADADGESVLDAHDDLTAPAATKALPAAAADAAVQSALTESSTAAKPPAAAAATATASAPTPSSALASSHPGTSAAEDTDASGTASNASDSDDDDDDDSDDDSDIDSDGAAQTIDEDLVAQQKEREGQLEEVAELERSVATARAECERQKNLLLRKRAEERVRSLRGELRMKRMAYGLAGEDDDDE